MGFIELLWESQRVAIFGQKMMKRRLFPRGNLIGQRGELRLASWNGEGGSGNVSQGPDDVV
jgi:hypothetical protein